MANYCENHLTITGRREDLEAFRDAAAEIDKHGESGKPIPLSFHKLVPIPDHIEALSDEYDVIALWMTTNWGCRGGALDTEHCFFCDNESGGQLVYEFLTRWTPPSMFVETVSAKYPRLIFTLIVFQPEAEFAGLYIASRGRLGVNINTKYDVDAMDELGGGDGCKWRFLPYQERYPQEFSLRISQ